MKTLDGNSPVVPEDRPPATLSAPARHRPRGRPRPPPSRREVTRSLLPTEDDGKDVVLPRRDARARGSGAFYTLVPIRPRWRCERRSLRTFAGVSLRPGSLAFNPRPRRLSTPSDAFQLHPDVRLYGTALRSPGCSEPRTGKTKPSRCCNTSRCSPAAARRGPRSRYRRASARRGNRSASSRCDEKEGKRATGSDADDDDPSGNVVTFSNRPDAGARREDASSRRPT